jgi:hypothetical protein
VDECPYDALEWVGDLTRSGSSSEALVEEMVEKLPTDFGVTR